VFQDRIQDRQQFVHTGDQRHLAFFVTHTHLAARWPGWWDDSGGDQGRPGQGGPDRGAARHITPGLGSPGAPATAPAK